MKHLATWWEYDLNPTAPVKEEKDISKTRSTVKVVLFNDANQVALIYYPELDGYPETYTLPGGGVEEGENFEQALRREVMEETGYEIENITELGEIIEYHTKKEGGLKNQCLGYKATVTGDKQERTLTDREKTSGQEIIWLNYQEALTRVGTDENGIVKERALLLLKLAAENKQ